MENKIECPLNKCLKPEMEGVCIDIGCQIISNNKQLICINNKPFSVNEIGPNLTLDKEYNLESIFVCSCKEEHYNVGLEEDVNYIECYKCRETLPKGFRWCHSNRFKIKD